jgi:hypothetical protein
MDDFNFYRFIAYLIGFAIAAMLLAGRAAKIGFGSCCTALTYIL